MTLPHDGGDLPSALVEDDDRIDLSDVKWDDTLSFVAFWALAAVVFTQFFTRYVLNDSLGWTEEIARYLLIAVTFFGLFMAVRKESNIAVEIFYAWMPLAMRRALSTAVDAVSVAFFAVATWLSVELAQRGNQMMTSIDVPKAVVYWGVAVGFAACTAYAVVRAVEHWRTGSSPLVRIGERPRAARGTGAE